MIKFEFDETTAHLVCRFEGRMDTAVNAEAQAVVEERVNALLATQPEKLTVVFDLEKVTYVSSAYLRICILVAKRVGAGRFSVRGTSPTLKKIFLVAGLDNVFAVG